MAEWTMRGLKIGLLICCSSAFIWPRIQNARLPAGSVTLTSLAKRDWRNKAVWLNESKYLVLKLQKLEKKKKSSFDCILKETLLKWPHTINVQDHGFVATEDQIWATELYSLKRDFRNQNSVAQYCRNTLLTVSGWFSLENVMKQDLLPASCMQ